MPLKLWCLGSPCSGPPLKQEDMNKRGKEDEDITLRYFSNFINIGSCIETFITNQYLRVKNWKFNKILKPKVGTLLSFRKNPRRRKL